MDKTDIKHKIIELLEEAESCQNSMHSAWKASKDSLIPVYDERGKHCEKIAELYIKLLELE